MIVKLLQIVAALVLNIPAVFACLVICSSLNVLPSSPGDGAVGAGLLYLGVGYLLSLGGLILCQACMALAFYVGRRRSIFKVLAVISCVFFVAIVVSLIVLGPKWQNGLLAIVFYGFLVVESGLWIMFLSDSVGRRIFHASSVITNNGN